MADGCFGFGSRSLKIHPFRSEFISSMVQKSVANEPEGTVFLGPCGEATRLKSK